MKDPLVVNPLEIVALDGPKKSAYVGTLLSSEEREQMQSVLEPGCVRLESLRYGRNQPDVGLPQVEYRPHGQARKTESETFPPGPP